MFLCRNAGHVNRYSLLPNHPGTEAAPGQESKGRPLYYLSACRRPIQRISTRNLTPNSIPRKTRCRFLARCHAESGFCNCIPRPQKAADFGWSILSLTDSATAVTQHGKLQRDSGDFLTRCFGGRIASPDKTRNSFCSSRFSAMSNHAAPVKTRDVQPQSAF